MFERFTERARQVVVFSQEESRKLGHGYIGVEHILLGLIREEEGVAARVLKDLGVDEAVARTYVVDHSKVEGKLPGHTGGNLPFTPRAKKVLELSLREALSLGHNYIGTEHILLGLVRETGSVVHDLLAEFDVDSEKVRNEVVRMLCGPTRRQRIEKLRPKYFGDYALVRVVPPVTGASWSTLCSVEVSSDEGETWRTLGTQGINIETNKDEAPIITAKIVAIPDVVDVTFTKPEDRLEDA